MAEIGRMTAAEITAAYRDRSLSPVEVLKDALGRIDRFESEVNAFTLVDSDGAMATARAAEARWRKGEPLGPADGLVASVKSNVAATGWPLRRGSTTIGYEGASFDAPPVASLRAAGCVLVGQTTMPEFGWIGVTHSKLTGITRNPWNRARTPGGSSGGAAAAAALGIGSFHIGTDGAGSIRIPSAFSGLFGIMPGVGRVPAFPASPFGLLARLGPMTRRVDDGALMLRIMARPDARDIYHDGAEPPDYAAATTAGIRGLRIGFSATLGWVDKLDPAIRTATAAIAARLTEFGAIVEEADPGFTRDEARRPLKNLWDAGCAQVLKGVPEAKRKDVDAGFRRCAAAGDKLAATDVLQALAERAALYETMRRFHERYDLLLTPTMPVTAIEAGVEVPRDGSFGSEWFDWSPYTWPFNVTAIEAGVEVPRDGSFGSEWFDWSPYTWPFNVTGQPAASVPVGLAPDGLPIGLQIVGPKGREDLVLRVAKGVELLADFPLLDGVRG